MSRSFQPSPVSKPDFREAQKIIFQAAKHDQPSQARLSDKSGHTGYAARYRVRLNYYLIANLGVRERSVAGPSGPGSLVLCLRLKRGSDQLSTRSTDMLHRAPPTTLTTLSERAVHDISVALITLLSDVFALYLKTKNFHWHMSGPHFRDYHLMLDDQGEQIFAMTDAIAERARKLGGTTIRSIGQISRFQRIVDNDAEYVAPPDMIAELRDDNAGLTRSMREVHSLCDEAGDVATASLLENWIDETEKRTWFLFECGRDA
jgi:starvation-inducible DNA-binding protein